MWEQDYQIFRQYQQIDITLHCYFIIYSDYNLNYKLYLLQHYPICTNMS